MSVQQLCLAPCLVKLIGITLFQGIYDGAFISFEDFPEYMLLKIALPSLRNDIVLHMKQVVMEDMLRVLNCILKMSGYTSYLS